MSIDDLLSEHTDEIARLALRLRDVILEAMPDATERVYPTWHGIGYRDARAGYVCGIFPHADRVEVTFERGSEIPDPDGIFDAGGKQVRTITFTRWDARRARAIPRVIDRALLLGSARNRHRR